MSFIDAVRAHYGDERPQAASATRGVTLAAVPAAGDFTSYVAKVCQTVIDTPPGHSSAPGAGRNNALNCAAYTLGRIVAAGQLDYFVVADALTAAGKAAGLDDVEIAATIRSGLKAGEREPRALETREAVTPAAVTVLPMPDPVDLDAFWDSRPILAHLRAFAQARMCSPWAVLGCALVRVVVATPPFHTLPPLVGSYASLNLFVALVGPSGTGKGAAEAAAADALHVGHIEHAHVGSGEGVTHLFAKREKGEVVRIRESVLFTIPEVDNMVALGARQGATLMPQLRMAWSGESLGFAYVDPAKNLRVDRHTYRLGLLLGVQPGRAAPLLDDADGGTPQRFLWMPTTDPDAPDTTPDEPAPLTWTLANEPRLANIHGLSVMDFPRHVREYLRDDRRARLRGESAGLDGHAGLARMKAAAAFALLDGRTDVNDEDWHLSGTLMAISDACRAGVQAHLSQTRRAANVARGEAEAERALVVAEKVDAAQVKRVCRVITRALRRGEDAWQSRRDIASHVASRDRAVVDEAIGALLDAGQIETKTEADRTLYRLTDRSDDA